MVRVEQRLNALPQLLRQESVDKVLMAGSIPKIGPNPSIRLQAVPQCPLR
jgi:hypothetical protein